MQKLTVVLASLVLLMINSAECGEPSGKLVAGQGRMKNPAKNPTPNRIKGEDMRQTGSSQAQLSYHLLQAVQPEGAAPANIMLSPGSLAAVLAFLGLGADEPMRQALAATLRLHSEAGLAAMRLVAKNLARQTPTETPLTLANALFFDTHVGLFSHALAKLRDAGMDSQSTTLTGDEGVSVVNQWVSERTKGLITTILDQPLPRPGLIALNALHFKDRWKTAFNPAQTRSMPFNLVGGNAVEVPMMHIELSVEANAVRVRQNERFIAVELPYVTERFKLVILTTKDRPAAVNEFAPMSDWLTGGESDDNFRAFTGELSMPKFDLNMTTDLLPALDALGLDPARRSQTAFQGFAKAGLDIVSVPQHTTIDVDESGTTAAAATAVIALSRSLTTEGSVHIRIDKPFLFGLNDHSSHLVLLSGYVANPLTK